MIIHECKVMADIDQYRADTGISYQEIADKTSKDPASIKRQLREIRGGVHLNTAYEHARAVGGVVVFMPLSEWTEYQHISEYKNYKAEHDTQEEQISNLTKTIEEQQKTIDTQQKMINRLQERMMVKDEAVERKDELLRKLLIEKGVIED